MEAYQFSLAGPKGDNQDSLISPFLAGASTFAIIADGVGGHNGGKIASECATKAAHEILMASPDIEFAALFEQIHRQIENCSQQHPLFKNMATTLSILKVENHTGYVAHVGDSRIYHVRNSGLITRTQDQTEIAELVRQKVFTPEEALRYPRRNVLLSSLSAERKYNLYENEFTLVDGDIFLLVSDGFYQAVSKKMILESVDGIGSIEAFGKALQERCLVEGLKDDASAVILRI